MPFAFRLVPFVFALTLFSFSSPAFACDPKAGANCRGLTCTQQQLGTTVLDFDKQHIIACLASAYGGYVWKINTTEVGTSTWVQVPLNTADPFDPLCEYRIYFAAGGYPGGGYLVATHAGAGGLLTTVSSHQHALGKILATDKTKWFYTISGDSANSDCHNPANANTNICSPGTSACINCEASLVNVAAILKRCEVK